MEVWVEEGVAGGGVVAGWWSSGRGWKRVGWEEGWRVWLGEGLEREEVWLEEGGWRGDGSSMWLIPISA